MADIYVDNQLAAAITDGTYDIATRGPGGSDGDAYPHIVEALPEVAAGDTVWIRGGDYGLWFDGGDPFWDYIDLDEAGALSGTDFGAGAITVTNYAGEDVNVGGFGNNTGSGLSRILNTGSRAYWVIKGNTTGRLWFYGYTLETAGAVAVELGANCKLENVHVEHNPKGDLIRLVSTGNVLEAVQARVGGVITTESGGTAGRGIVVSGDNNTLIDCAAVDTKMANAIEVTGSNNEFRNCSATAWGHLVSNHGIKVSGAGNLFVNTLAFLGGGGNTSAFLVSGGSGNLFYNCLSEEFRIGAGATSTEVKNTIYSLRFTTLDEIEDLGTGSDLSSNMLASNVGWSYQQQLASDFRLPFGSPAIDAGEELAEVTEDYRGEARPEGAATDIGPYERVAGDPTPPDITSFSPTATSPGSTITLTIAGTGFGVGTAVVTLRQAENPFALVHGITVISYSSRTATEIIATVWCGTTVGAGNYWVRVTNVDGFYDQASYLVVFRIDTVNNGAAALGEAREITVNGSGFDAGTAVLSFVDSSGSPVTGVSVLSYSVRTSSQIVALVAVGASTDVGSYYTRVTNSAGFHQSLSFSVTEEGGTDVGGTGEAGESGGGAGGRNRMYFEILHKTDLLVSSIPAGGKWRTRPIAIPEGDWYATVYSRNLFGVGTRLVSEQFNPGPPAYQKLLLSDETQVSRRSKLQVHGAIVEDDATAKRTILDAAKVYEVPPDTSSFAPDLSFAQIFDWTVPSGENTLENPVENDFLRPDCKFVMKIRQGGGGTLVFGDKYRVPKQIRDTELGTDLTETTGALDKIGFQYDGADDMVDMLAMVHDLAIIE